MIEPKGWYIPGNQAPSADRSAVLEALQDLQQDLAVVQTPAGAAVASGGTAYLSADTAPLGSLPLLATVAALSPSQLGDPSFQRTHGVRANYVAGAMANGISSERLVIAMARHGLLGFFGAAGLTLPRIESAIDTLQSALGTLPHGFNLIHAPQDPEHERAVVELFLRRGVRCISASAFMKLSANVVVYRFTGAHRDAGGRVIVPNQVFAKVSRPEVAEPFMRPPPEAMLNELVAQGRLTLDEARLAALLPVAEDLTAEADSGGHTDFRPLPVLLPTLLALRNRVAAEQAYDRPIRVGAAGGIGTPDAVAAAFAMGAAYVLTGTVNQACVESGTSDLARQMLATAGPADVGKAPAGDMFEHGAHVQVLKRGTLFAMRGNQLYDLYKRLDGLDDIPTDERERLESSIFRMPLSQVWGLCESFFAERDPAQIERAARDPRHKMALVFRWYFGLSSRWAQQGNADRKADLQIWCGPAIGAFNAWTRGSVLEAPENRSAPVVAANLMAGAAAILRARSLQQQGVDPGPEASVWVPRPLA